MKCRNGKFLIMIGASLWLLAIILAAVGQINWAFSAVPLLIALMFGFLYAVAWTIRKAWKG